MWKEDHRDFSRDVALFDVDLGWQKSQVVIDMEERSMLAQTLGEEREKAPPDAICMLCSSEPASQPARMRSEED